MGANMTALKPTENRHVRAVSSERYPLNEISSHPESTQYATDHHHVFPRSMIGGDSWFVEIDVEFEDGSGAKAVIPHVVGLTREEHRQVEEHEAWIKLEDGIFNWYDRVEGPDPDLEWDLRGPLNPQPGQQGTPKKKRRNFTGEARRNRATISVKVPKDDQEDGAAIWDEHVDLARERLILMGLTDSDTYPVYNVIVSALDDWLTNHWLPL
jgi:hypothetical protein